MISLAEVLLQGVVRNPDGVAIREQRGEITYRALNGLVDRLANALLGLGVGTGDRVAIRLPKSIEAIAAMQAALRVGAVYVPIDPAGPIARGQLLLADSRPAACITSRAWGGSLAGVPTLLADDDAPPGERFGSLPAPGDPPRSLAGGDDLAYILFTSGSTGRPKGVCTSHRNALAFVEWACRALRPTAQDRFANHAPLHFDLSVLDVYVAFAAGATVALIPDDASFLPRRLVDLVRSDRITVWYSVPSALTMMVEQGGLSEAGASLRAVLFAGEPFPVKHLRRLREALPAARMLNLYGPTETNVCTFEEIFDVPEGRTDPMPIGRACCGDMVWAEREDGSEAAIGERGELVVEGPTVMAGYWGEPPQRGPYRTGDVVTRVATDVYQYVGRRDSLVKVRGHRVELGEVDAALLSHPDVREAAAVAVGIGPEARLVGFVSCAGDRSPSLLELKRHCAALVPRSMLVSELHQVDALPRTANGKVDRQALVAACEEVHTP